MTRLEELKYVRDELRGSEPTDDTYTGLLGNALPLLEQPREAIADRLGVSRPTLSRWMRGTNLPHPVMRAPILKKIADLLDAKAKVLDRELKAAERRAQSSGGHGDDSVSAPAMSAKAR